MNKNTKPKRTYRRRCRGGLPDCKNIVGLYKDVDGVGCCEQCDKYVDENPWDPYWEHMEQEFGDSEEYAELEKAGLVENYDAYEKAYEKDRIIKNLNLLLKQAAVDCEIHRKLHSRNGEVLQCMRFDTTTKSEDLAYKPNLTNDEKDLFYLRNTIRKKRRLQKIRIKGFELILDPDSKEIFDAQAYEDNRRLLKLGLFTPTEINWFRL
jgi:hypothetical protein